MSSLPSMQLCRQFSLDEVLSATQNFDDALVVGKGGFGKVYKATITDENGESFIVAIKRLSFDSRQGATEFWAEIKMLSKLRHCNLVSLIGYCHDNSEMILIYEFMPHGTLDDHLHRKGISLSWVQRLKISIGAARGLHYLHTGSGAQYGVIHRDVKSTNILLDEDCVAKISDFGLARNGSTNTTGAYVETGVKGTYGYLDPMYFMTGQLTMKTDVYAFGVVLFELLCGRAAVDTRLDENKQSLAVWACEFVKKGKVHNIIDLQIQIQIAPKCLNEFVKIAYRCLSNELGNRPKMAEIVVALELSLTLQNKFDNLIKPATSILSIGRLVKWPFISHEVNSAQTKSLEKDNVDHASSSEHSDEALALELKRFSFDDVKKATGSFRHDMEKGSLDMHLFRRNITPLSWKTRVQITLGIAEALSFLERTQDLDDYHFIRPQEILLDKDFNAKISYAELTNLEDTFMDPLFYHPSKLNDSGYHGCKSNVRAFGQLLVHILTGERDCKIGALNLRNNTKNWRGEQVKKSLTRALDPRLPNVDDTTIKEAIALVGVALSCLDDPFYTLSKALDTLQKL